MSKFISSVFEDFCNKYKDIEIVLQRESFIGLKRGLEEETLDIIFSFDFEVKLFKNVVYNSVCSATAGLLVNANNKLLTKENLLASDFEDEILYLPKQDDYPGRMNELKTVFADSGLKYKEIVYVSNRDSMIFNVMAGKGITIADSTEEMYNPDLYFYPLHAAPYAQMVCAWKQNNLNPAVALFANQFDNKNNN